MRKGHKPYQVLDLKVYFMHAQKSSNPGCPTSNDGSQVLHTICGQDCVQAQMSAPSALIYIVFIDLLKNMAGWTNSGFTGVKYGCNSRFALPAQFRTKNVDKIVRKRLDSILVP